MEWMQYHITEYDEWRNMYEPKLGIDLGAIILLNLHTNMLYFSGVPHHNIHEFVRYLVSS